MSTEVSIRHELEQIVRTALSKPELQLHDDLLSVDVPGWDSLAHMKIVLAIETRWGLQFSPRQFAQSRRFGELVSIVESSTQT